jgi:anti-sigma B factor antagonist
MTTQQPRLPPIPQVGAPAELVSGGVTAIVADDARTLLVTISRQADTALTGADDPLTVVAIDGEIDLDTAPLVRLILSNALDGRTPVCCDLSRVTFFGATAVNTVLAAHRQATASGNSFFLRGVQGITDRVLTLCDPDRVIPR